jgi:hypothetical protein
MMDASHGRGAVSWGWGSQRQLLACRLSHLLGLVAVLTLLLILGWTPASDLAGQVSGLLAR